MLRCVTATAALGLAAAAAGADALSAGDQDKLRADLTELRAANDPILMLTPIDRIGDLGPRAVEAALSALMPLLDSSSAEVRREVLHVLHPPVRLGPPQLARLGRLQADLDDEVRAEGCRILGEQGSAGDHSEQTKEEVVTASLDDRHLIGELANPDIDRRERAAKVLRERLPDPNHRRAIADAATPLAVLARSLDRGVRAISLTLMARCLVRLDAQQFAAAFTDLQDDTPAVVEAAIEAISLCPEDSRTQAANGVRPIAMDAQNPLHARAIATLEAIGAWDRTAEDAAIAALGSDDASAQLVLQACLGGNEHDPKLTDAVAAACADESRPGATRFLAMKALVAMAPPSQTESVLERVLGQRSQGVEARKGACIALMSMADKAGLALTTLRGVSSDQREDPELRKVAQSAATLISRQ